MTGTCPICGVDVVLSEFAAEHYASMTSVPGDRPALCGAACRAVWQSRVSDYRQGGRAPTPLERQRLAAGEREPGADDEEG